MSIRSNIDEVVSAFNDCLYDTIPVEKLEAIGSEECFRELFQEVVDGHGPFTDEEVTYIFNHMVIDTMGYDLLGQILRVNWAQEVIVTKQPVG